MLIDDIKKIKSEKKDLRNFGLTVGTVLLLLGGVLWWRGRTFYPYFIGIGAALVFTGLMVPSVLRPFQKAWMTIAVVIGWFMTRAILCFLFFLVVTPLGIISRLFGKDFLNKKFSPNSNKKSHSYWVPKDNTAIDKSRYMNQF
ncbi:MAG: hypothetical protein HZB61_06780 [Nitrospirae bacterium]|nr:hypothetical protein [Nitrospirota bacterium]